MARKNDINIIHGRYIRLINGKREIERGEKTLLLPAAKEEDIRN